MGKALRVDDTNRGPCGCYLPSQARLELTLLQRALANQPWKEYTAEGGRKYWYNTETKQSTWEMPEVYKNALAQAQQTQGPAVA